VGLLPAVRFRPAGVQAVVEDLAPVDEALLRAGRRQAAGSAILEELLGRGFAVHVRRRILDAMAVELIGPDVAAVAARYRPGAVEAGLQELLRRLLAFRLGSTPIQTVVHDSAGAQEAPLAAVERAAGGIAMLDESSFLLVADLLRIALVDASLEDVVAQFLTMVVAGADAALEQAFLAGPDGPADALVRLAAVVEALLPNPLGAVLATLGTRQASIGRWRRLVLRSVHPLVRGQSTGRAGSPSGARPHTGSVARRLVRLGTGAGGEQEQQSHGGQAATGHPGAALRVAGAQTAGAVHHDGPPDFLGVGIPPAADRPTPRCLRPP